jgi:hypothetical protein
MEQEKILHLEFIQNIINRMNSNSFQIKEWMITIVSALLALYASSDNVTYIFVAIVPTLLFWYLDAYYLQLERKFRGLYDDVKDPEKSIPFFSMDITNYKDGRFKFCECLFSKTTAPLYLLIAGFLFFGGLYLMKVI